MMWPIRICATAALALLALYSVLRAIAGSCEGSQCDIYIIPSVALPLAVVVVVAVTGGLAVAWARKVARSWVVILSVTTLMGIVGPPAALAIFRDQPDSLVLAATLFLVVGPVAALVFTVSESPGDPAA